MLRSGAMASSPPSSSLYIGLMSGTSTDGVDGLLLDAAAPPTQAVRGFVSLPLPAALRTELLALNRAGENELHRAAIAANALVSVYADAVADLLQQSGLPASAIAAIGAHGQTVRHQPGAFDGVGYTLQLNAPALLAERTGITVVADFRSRDVAAGGQGAPLVPFFHRLWFGGDAEKKRALAVLNIGGISNISLLPANGGVRGFDTGPGNVLLDAWVQLHLGHSYDADGAWAAGGQVDAPLLVQMLAEAYFAQPAPKSTGRDLFHLPWLQAQLACLPVQPSAQDVQTTLLELTARSIADALLQALPEVPQLVVCGGGAYNGALMARLQALLPTVSVQTSAAFGLQPNQVEAAAFAWLAAQCVQGLALPLPSVTGARAPRVLGAIYPA
jgi:anhydro-N-acetylmuramic acid kinase